VITEAVNRMGSLIDNLLIFSHMGRQEMFRTTVASQTIVQGVIREIEHEANGRPIEWKVGELADVNGDPAMLRQVWVNLISNAIKYTRDRARTKIEIGSDNSSSGETIYFVRDNGVGFDMEYVQKLFGVFQRLHRDSEFKGTGIGLANVRRVINRHGGRTWAEGKVDAGATFFFSIPKSSD
jgi:light-regulated signal transduction histidine kinase (bacteriophytochrome)